MGHKVIFTPQSLEDLKEIVRYIARDNPERARTFGNELIDRAVSLTTFPEIGRILPEIGNTMVREVVHRSYRIIYEVSRDENLVFVLRFWHGARGKPDLQAGT